MWKFRRIENNQSFHAFSILNIQRRLKRDFPCLSVSPCLCNLQRLAIGIQKQTGEDQRGLAKPFWAQFFPTGHPLQNTCPLVTIVPPVCLLADTSNNPGIWPASKLITTLGGIDPSSGGFPSRAVCGSPPTELYLALCDFLRPLFFLRLLHYFMSSAMCNIGLQLIDERCCYKHRMMPTVNIHQVHYLWSVC